MPGEPGIEGPPGMPGQQGPAGDKGENGRISQNIPEGNGFHISQFNVGDIGPPGLMGPPGLPGNIFQCLFIKSF